MFNDGPAFYVPRTVPALATTYGDFDLDPLPGQAVIPANFGSGPAQFTMNLRVSKTFGFGEATGRASGRSDAGGPPPGGEEGPVPGPGAGPLGMGGRGGRPPRGGQSSENSHRYNLTLSAQIHNIFNTVNLAAPIGDLESPLFGRSVALAGGPFNSATANRRISLELAFRF